MYLPSLPLSSVPSLPLSLANEPSLPLSLANNVPSLPPSLSLANVPSLPLSLSLLLMYLPSLPLSPLLMYLPSLPLSLLLMYLPSLPLSPLLMYLPQGCESLGFYLNSRILSYHCSYTDGFYALKSHIRILLRAQPRLHNAARALLKTRGQGQSPSC